MKNHSRLAYVDIAKGVAMLLVIIGHCSYSEKVLVGWLYSFHMPLFFALSGFTFRPEKYKSLREVVSVKARQLIIPYFFFSVLLWMLSLLLLDGMHLEYRHMNELIGIVLSNRLSDYFFALWFLTTLFLAEPILWLTLRLTRARTLLLLPLSIAAFFSGSVVLNALHGTYWSADLVPIALSFLLLGYMLRHWMDRFQAISKSILPLLAAWSVNLLFFWLNYIQVGRSDLYFCKLGNPLYFFLSACGGTLGAILLCQRIARCAELEYVGRNSMVFYAFESLAIPLSERLLRSAVGSSALQGTSHFATFMVLSLSCGMLAIASTMFRKRGYFTGMQRPLHLYS